MFDVTVKDFLIHMTDGISLVILWDSDHEESLFDGTPQDVKKSEYADCRIDTFSIGMRKVAGAPSSIYERIMGSTKDIPTLNIKIR